MSGKWSSNVQYDAVKKEWGSFTPKKSKNESSFEFGQQILDSLSEYGRRVAQVLKYLPSIK